MKRKGSWGILAGLLVGGAVVLKDAMSGSNVDAKQRFNQGFLSLTGVNLRTKKFEPTRATGGLIVVTGVGLHKAAVWSGVNKETGKGHNI